MPNTKTIMRSILSINLLCALGIYAHAESSYVDLYQNQSTVTAADDSQMDGSRVTTQRRVISSRPTSNANADVNQDVWSTRQPQQQQPQQPQQSQYGTIGAVAKEPAYMRPALPASAMPTARQTSNTPRSFPAAVTRTPTTQPTATFASAASVVSSAPTSVPMPKVSISNISYVPTVMIPVSSYGSEQLDVSLLDDFIKEMSPHARHYPPNFENASEKYYSTKELEEFEEWLRPYAERPDASYDVLLRAAKLNGMARNLDFGSEYAMRGSNYVARAIEKQPNSEEANFLYGMMLAEGGGFREGKKYLDKAAGMGYIEAEQSLAQSDLLSDRKSAALERLQRLQRENPNNTQIRRQVNIVQNGEYYIWDLDEEFAN